MSASGVKAGEAYVVISAKLDSLRADLKKIPQAVSGVGKSFGGVGSALSSMLSPAGAVVAGVTAVGAALAKSTSEFISFGSTINDAAARTGLATDELQHMKFAAEQTGASLADIEIAARGMARNGLSLAKFEEIGMGIAGISDPSERAAKAMDVFGKSGTKLIPMFAELKSLKASSAALGPILTDAEVSAADALGDSFGALGESIKRAMRQIGASIGPYLQSILDNAIGMIAAAADTIKALRNANSFGSGGDILDVLANSDLYNPSGFAARGAAGRAAMSKNNGLSGLDDEGPMGGRATKDAATSSENIWRSIEAANKSRIALIREFETPAERFIAKQKEINNALMTLNRNRVLGFVGEGEAAGQRAGLEQAMRRLQAEEMERRARLFKGVAGETQSAQAEVMRSSKGTFSAAGAAVLGRSGDSAEFRESKTQTGLLRKIDDGIRKVVRPTFS